MSDMIKVRLVGTRSNRSAIGARILVLYGSRMQAQEVMSQCSYLSSNDPRLHFGLGEETTVRIEVHWPSGLYEMHREVKVNQLLVLREGGPMKSIALR